MMETSHEIVAVKDIGHIGQPIASMGAGLDFVPQLP